VPENAPHGTPEPGAPETGERDETGRYLSREAATYRRHQSSGATPAGQSTRAVVRSRARWAIRDTRGLPTAATVSSLASKGRSTRRTAYRFRISERAADLIQQAGRTHGAAAGLASNRQETK
jgi:hypothetical protein